LLEVDKLDVHGRPLFANPVAYYISELDNRTTTIFVELEERMYTLYYTLAFCKMPEMAKLLAI